MINARESVLAAEKKSDGWRCSCFKGVHRNWEKVIRGQNSAPRSDIITD